MTERTKETIWRIVQNNSVVIGLAALGFGWAWKAEHTLQTHTQKLNFLERSHREQEADLREQSKMKAQMLNTLTRIDERQGGTRQLLETMLADVRERMTKAEKKIEALESE